MKKFLAILSAALMSVSVWASVDVVPTDAVLADYYNEGQVCVCIFVPAAMACNDIVLTGSFNGWSSTVADCMKFMAIAGYDGWYVAAFDPEEEPDEVKGIQAKPIMLDVDGNFNWEYQIGAATVISGDVMAVSGAYAGEIDLLYYGTDEPNVYTVDAWKQNPCTAVYHYYTITVISDGCDGMAVPYLVGSMNSWSFQQMNLDVDKTIANNMAPTYTVYFKAAEGTPYQIVSGLMDESGEMEEEPAWNDNAYIQTLVDGKWVRLPGEEGDYNLLTGEEANIVFDLRDEDKRWARCAPQEPDEYVVLRINLPTENSPQAVEIIGTFDNWEGTAMEHLDNGWWHVELEAKASQYFKFRSAGSWEKEIAIYSAETDEWAKIEANQFIFGELWEDSSYKGEECKWIELDWSDPEMYRWEYESVPSDEKLAEYYNEGQVCVCIFVPSDIACNDIVLTGTFNGWSSTLADCPKFAAIDGYDGWYVTAFDPEEEPNVETGIQAKPVMLDEDGNFNWEYQIGAATVISGDVVVVSGAYAGEIDLLYYGTDAPNVYTVDAWKQNPCTAVYHNYTITVVNDGCNGMAIPYLVGGMTSWSFEPMELDAERTIEINAPVYTASFKASENTPYQIVSGLMNESGEIVEEPAWNDDAYMQKWVDDEWVRVPGEEGDYNLLTHETANILWDLRADTLRWARCDDSPVEYTILVVNFPSENCPEKVEVIGTFDNWDGTVMELLDTGWWLVELEAKESQYFKFRSAGSWDQELEIYDAENDEWALIADKQFKFGQLWEDETWKGEPCKYIELDMSDPELYRWTDNSEPDDVQYYLVGSGTPLGSWILDNAMIMDGDSIVLTLPANAYEFKIFPNQNADTEMGYSFFDPECSSEGVVEGEHANWAKDGNIKFYLAQENVVIIKVVEGKVCVTGTFCTAEDVPVYSYSLVGDEILFGDHWRPENERTDMTQVDNNIWTYTLDSVRLFADSAATYQVVANHTWSLLRYPSEDEAYVIRVYKTDDYSITFTLDIREGCTAEVAYLHPEQPAVTIFGLDIVVDPTDSTNVVDFYGDSTLVYNPEENTLTLNNLTLEVGEEESTAINYTGTETLTIVLNDSSSIMADTIIASTADVIITGEGTLIAEGTVPIIGVPEANITFDSVNMHVQSLPSAAAVRRRIRGGKRLDETGGPALSGFGSAEFNKVDVTPSDAMYGPINNGSSDAMYALYVMNGAGEQQVLSEFTLTAKADEPNAVEQISTPQAFDPTQPMYNIFGVRVDASYKGIIIQNGNKYLR